MGRRGAGARGSSRREGNRIDGEGGPRGSSRARGTPDRTRRSVIVVDAAAVVDALTAVAGREGLRASLTDEELQAPTLLDFEVVSGLRRLTLTDRLSTARAQDALTDFEDLPTHRWHTDDALRRRAFSLRHNLGVRRRLRRTRRRARMHAADPRCAPCTLERTRRANRCPLRGRCPGRPAGLASTVRWLVRSGGAQPTDQGRGSDVGSWMSATNAAASPLTAGCARPARGQLR